MSKIIIRAISILLMVTCVLGSAKIIPIFKSGYDSYKNAISEKPLEKRIEEIKGKNSYVKFNDISDKFINTLIKSEDKRFYFHFGIDPLAISRAMYNNIKCGSFVQGGSTISQQLAKNMYFSFEKSYKRKIAEMFVTFDLEKTYTKKEILEFYCNTVYFGENCYGLKEAANHYYGVNPDELSVQQAFALVKTLRCPNKYNPNVYKNDYNKIVSYTINDKSLAA